MCDLGSFTKQTPEQVKQKARERAAAWRRTDEYKRWREESREVRKAYKAKYRRLAGVPTLSEKRWAKKQKELAKADSHIRLRESLVAALHCAHVKKYFSALKAREVFKQQYMKHHDKQIERVSKYKSNLPDAYIVQNLKSMGLATEQITPDLIAIKREAMQFRRLSSQAKTVLSTYWKENHEAISQHA